MGTLDAGCVRGTGGRATYPDEVRLAIWVLILGPAVLLSTTGWEAGFPARNLLIDALAALVIAAAGDRVGRTPPSSVRRLAGWVAVAGTAVALSVVAWDRQPDASWPISTAWAAAIAAGLLTAHPAGRPALIGAALLAAGAVLAPLTIDPPEALNESLMMSTVVAVSIGAGAAVRNQRRLADAERRAAVIGERQAMARELHDVIAHEISGIVVLAQAIGPQAQAGGVGPAVSRIEQAGRRALEQIRSLVATATPATPATAPTAPDAAPTPEPPRDGTLDETRRLVEEFAATTPADVRFVAGEPRDFDDLDPAVALAVHRVVAEALTNIRRHAATATRVDVLVRAEGDDIVVRVGDDGRGGGLGAGSGTGLSGLTERALLVGGSAGAGRDDGRWVVQARMPRRGLREG